ncbi:hypothetical protein BOX24_03680 [Leptospirillum ferriphilum]|uniref:Uncharacterized protein n=2 Tax=Leptospirillum ferriphilum TaxID=178606 RepID=A0A1V3SXZ9_9BACT|nr:hypothetical protein LFML04_1720 [Leptospirillum ferriphilum ML-04]OOH73590.1 hypothetical protein BOX24_03680 [Leptospirillum ferriphilum]
MGLPAYSPSANPEHRQNEAGQEAVPRERFGVSRFRRFRVRRKTGGMSSGRIDLDVSKVVSNP